MLPGGTVSSRQLFALEQGSILPLHSRADEPAVLYVAKQKLFTAQPVRSGNHRAAQVVKDRHWQILTGVKKLNSETSPSASGTAAALSERLGDERLRRSGKITGTAFAPVELAPQETAEQARDAEQGRCVAALYG